MAIETWNSEDPPPSGQGWSYSGGRSGQYTRNVPDQGPQVLQQISQKLNIPVGQIETVMKDVGSGRSGQQTVGYYSYYDPATNIVTNFDSSGNLLESGQRGSGKGILESISSGATQFLQDPSKALTNALQPVEKTVNYIAAHPEMQLAIAMAVAVPVVGEYIGAELMAAGVVTSAETATVIGTAIASTSAQVAQGVPLEQAIQNTAADVAVSQLSPAAAKQLDGLLHSPAVTDAITSTVAFGAATAARGGSQEEIEKAMTAGLAGSAASSAYKSVAKSAPDIYSKTIGGATAGAVKGGTEGAVIGGLSSAAGSLSRPSSSTNLAADTGGGGDLEPYVDPSLSGEPAKLDPRLTPLEDGTGWRDRNGNIYSKNDFAVNVDDGTLIPRTYVSGGSQLDDPSTTINLPSSPVAPLDVTQNQSQAETERLARQNEILKLIQTPETPVYDYDPTTTPSVKTEPVYLGELPEVTITGTREKEYTPDITTPTKPITAIPSADAPTAPPTTPPAADAPTAPPTAGSDPTPPPSLAEPEVPIEEPPAEEAPADKPSTYKPDILYGYYKKPKAGASYSSTLGAALGTTGTTTGLTAERGAGEIEGTGTGGKRKKVWNEESLKLKDALGV